MLKANTVKVVPAKTAVTHDGTFCFNMNGSFAPSTVPHRVAFHFFRSSLDYCPSIMAKVLAAATLSSKIDAGTICDVKLIPSSSTIFPASAALATCGFRNHSKITVVIAKKCSSYIQCRRSIQPTFLFVC